MPISGIGTLIKLISTIFFPLNNFQNITNFLFSSASVLQEDLMYKRKTPPHSLFWVHSPLPPTPTSRIIESFHNYS